jgi:2-oxoglutarate dehydrogenase E1 component
MKTDDMQTLWDTSYLEGGNMVYLESLYESFLANPDSVEPHWREYFESLASGVDSAENEALANTREYFTNFSTQSVAPATSGSTEHAAEEAYVADLINAYRSYGHHLADLDPLGLTKKETVRALTLAYHNLSDADLDKVFHAGCLIGLKEASLRDILASLKKTYCHHIAVEYMHMTNTGEREWLQDRMESVQNQPAFSPDVKQRILSGLTHAEGFENYLGVAYVGQKRFSLEGGDSLIPLLDAVIDQSAKAGVDECVMAMAHRGRLNVLVNILGKATKTLLAEFDGTIHDVEGSGDVKYHKGFSSDVDIDGKRMHLALAFNPSHLEITGPVVQGSVRARQRRRQDAPEKVLSIVMHGDSAMSGQGVVMETLNFSRARGFSTAGCLHIAINNQVGFTTSRPEDLRSTLYCTDIGKMIQAPIFHVNGNDPEAVCLVARLAIDYRQRFQKDVIIDLVCYRRNGHNEADDPSITQPEMYQIIKKLPTTRAMYAKTLEAEKLTTSSKAKELLENYMDRMGAGENIVDVVHFGNGGKFAPDWRRYIGNKLSLSVDTTVSVKRLKKLATELMTIPDDVTIHQQVKRLFRDRQAMTDEKQLMNWGYAETLAYATLLTEGYPVRLCGQDSGRGTFSHRHAVIHDVKTSNAYVPLQHLAKKQSPFIVIDSILSEEAVLAFEYGYSTADPDSLVIWEAQFGDFANGAQVVIDQFISSGEQKWSRLSGLTMLLPHGYEGMGPEHSSARLERYLQLCAQQNIQVCVPTTPAQMFHLLRRQAIRPVRKPLIVMTPKSMLRHKAAVSSFADLSDHGFQLIIPEDQKIKPTKVTRVVVCSGKVYYDLLQAREKAGRDDVALVRIEQLYPFPRKALTAELKRFNKAKTVVWCQEEPKNQGAWYQVRHHVEACLATTQTLEYAGRTASAAPACGYAKQHLEEQAALVKAALNF